MMSAIKILTCVSSITFIFNIHFCGCLRLSEWVSHYEPLEYDTEQLHRSHLRAKRSVTHSDAVVHLHFRAHGRAFSVRLKRDVSTFSDSLEVIGPSGNVEPVDTSHIYQGHILGEPGSHVFGSLSEGRFEGKIVSPHTGAYYVEHAHRYFKNATRPGVAPTPDNSVTFHSIIYHERDVSDPYHSRRSHGGIWTLCSATWRQVVADGDENERPQYRYTRQANLEEGKTRGKRSKRAARPKEENKNTCSLFIQTDPLIWRHVAEQQPNQPEAEKIREEILSLIAHHVTAVNYIYRDTKFDGRIEHRNIKFEVQRIKNIDVSNFLNLHSLGNHEDFCLAYVFTYRDFTGGTLGLAWVASASGASGGICEKYKTYTETVGGLYQSTKRSLNTGIITFVNYNSRVPPKVSQLTLAHEIGHNFGSPVSVVTCSRVTPTTELLCLQHDYPPECRPGGEKGNFIMFASATSGDRPNNSKFSACSVGNISNVLDAIEDSKKRNCFSASAGAFCGNKIVEAGEECDCGFNDEECQDNCCYPRILSELDRMKNQSARGCHRRDKTQCSPSQGPCCQSHQCRFVPAHHRQLCRIESECSYSSSCNGMSSECPAPAPKANKTKCNEGTQLCINGECTGSICLEWNMTECFLTSHLITNIDKRKLCELACQNGSDANSCRSTSDFAHLVGLKPGGISLRPGSPCDNFQCRAVDAEGPLARLKNLLFNKETLLSVAQWVTEYWWAVLLIGIAFIVVMGIFIKCCAVHTPSSNPKKQPARRISETLRHPMNTLRRMRGPYNGRPVPNARGPGPQRGYGEGRGQYHAPKASAPPGSYSRSNHPELYAGAYGGRSGGSGGTSSQNAFEMRHHKV
ncbi:hypothetical protein B566_EDAN003055 [Ephemera danica]|nr:hypothetical protein B566_EDAN003055 [Ephemera danica]